VSAGFKMGLHCFANRCCTSCDVQGAVRTAPAPTPRVTNSSGRFESRDGSSTRKRSIQERLAALNARWVNSISREVQASFNPTQFLWATQAGLMAPLTAFTNWSECAASVGETSGRMIYKSYSGYVFPEGKGWRQVIESMHPTATLAVWHRTSGRHEIFAKVKTVPPQRVSNPRYFSLVLC
jgi:hypothetical protein